MGGSLIQPVILCGGIGARLWPLSHEGTSKPFLRLIGPRSTFQHTVLRVADRAVFHPAMVVTGQGMDEIAAAQLREIDSSARFLVEPEPKDTGMAVAVAALAAGEADPQTLILVLAADHAIEEPEAFVLACRQAAEAAQAGYVMTFGVPPREPSAEFGYIEPGEPIHGSHGHRVRRFVEKPPALIARDYVDRGFLWNSGNLLFRADVMLEELARLHPTLLQAARRALNEARREAERTRLGVAGYEAAPRVSIDHAVMERTDRAGVLPVTYSWLEIGTWEAVWAATPRDGQGNALRGPVSLRDTANSLVWSAGPAVTVIGLDDIVVVAQSAAVLVARRGCSAQVKEVADLSPTKAAADADAGPRSWGRHDIAGEGAGYRIRRVLVEPGACLRWDGSRSRPEHWIIVRGTAQAALGNALHLLGPDDAFRIPAGAIVQVTNPGFDALEIIAVRTGEEGTVSNGRVSEIPATRDWLW